MVKSGDNTNTVEQDYEKMLQRNSRDDDMVVEGGLLLSKLFIVREVLWMTAKQILLSIQIHQSRVVGVTVQGILMPTIVVCAR